jgi:hypothetical protein
MSATGDHADLETPRILAVTRIHKGSSSHMASIATVKEFLMNSMKFAAAVLICVSPPVSNAY